MSSNPTKTAQDRAGTEVTVVGVAANDRSARARIARAISASLDLETRSAESVHELLEAEPGCTLIAIHCDSVGTRELSLFGRVKRERPELLIVVVCESTNGRDVRRAFDGGVDGLVFAAQLGETLAPTVAAVLAGQTVVPRELRAGIRKASLSFREKQILGMVVMGFTNGEIGARLFLAESTVKSHLSSAFSKLGVKSRSEAAAVIMDPDGSLGPGILAITADGLNGKAA